MTRINQKLGLKPGGAPKHLQRLSGVQCRACPHMHVTSTVIHGALTWRCAACGESWTPTAADIDAYKARVRARDRIEVT